MALGGEEFRGSSDSILAVYTFANSIDPSFGGGGIRSHKVVVSRVCSQLERRNENSEEKEDEPGSGSQGEYREVKISGRPLA